MARGEDFGLRLTRGRGLLAETALMALLGAFDAGAGAMLTWDTAFVPGFAQIRLAFQY